MNAHNQRVVADHNRKVDAHNRKVVNDYNQRVRAHNDRLRREVARLNSSSGTRHVTYRRSVTTLRQSFSQLESAADSPSWAGSDDLFDLSECETANSVAALNALLAEETTDPARDDEIAVLRATVISDELRTFWSLLVTESFGYDIEDSGFPQGGLRMAERGRPRAFDEEEVLDVAMRLFWEHGFDGTSMSDLTEAMGINRRSVYATFGNKEALFTAALEHYLAGPGAFVEKALALPTAREVAEAFLRGSVKAFTSSDRPSGCMAVQSALTCSDAAAAVRSDLAARRVAGVKAFRERFDRAQVEGDLPADVDPQALASYIVALSNGISVQANSGIGRAALSRTVEFVLSTWPSA